MLLSKRISGHTKMKDKKILSIAKQVVKLEIDSLKKLQSEIHLEKLLKQSSIVKMVELLFQA